MKIFLDLSGKQTLSETMGNTYHNKNVVRSNKMGTFTTILSIAQKSVNSFYYMFGFESIVFL